MVSRRPARPAPGKAALSVATSMSPTCFYRHLRLRYGLWRLKSTRRSVTAIALESGFSDCAHFSRQFREFYGVNPSEVRGGTPEAVLEGTVLADPRMFDE